MTTMVAIILKTSLLTFLVCSMPGMGLALAPQSLLAPLRNARLVAVTLAVNFVAAPAFAYLLTRVIPLEPPHATGLLLLGCAAGAPFLPKLVETARGDLALSVALMTLLPAGTTLFMPWALPQLAPGLEAKPWSIARPLLALILLPLVVGLVVRSCAPVVSARCQPWLARLTNVSVVLLLVTVIARDYRALLEVVGSGALLALAVFITGLFGLGWMLDVAGPQNRGVLGLTAAARNVGAAFVPASQATTDPQVITRLVVGTLVLLVLLVLAAVLLRRQRFPSPPLP